MISVDNAMNPRVTVLMAVYNGEQYLREALDSILLQTFTDFELLLIDDGSYDGTADILEEYRTRDQRVRIERNESNIGLTRSLNKGIDLSRGEYIARMDCDDISIPQRLEKQVAFLDADRRIGVCGSWAVLAGEMDGIVLKFPTDPDVIHSYLLFDNVIVHPSVMIRKQLLEVNGLKYNENYAQSQDYDLWVRCAERMFLANIPEVLLRLRKHTAQLSHTHAHGQNSTAWDVRKYQVERLGIVPDAEELETHRHICTRQTPVAGQFLLAAELWLRRLLEANDATGNYPRTEMHKIISSYWFDICSRASSIGLGAWFAFSTSRLKKNSTIGRLEMVRFLLKCLVKK